MQYKALVHIWAGGRVIRPGEVFDGRELGAGLDAAIAAGSVAVYLPLSAVRGIGEERERGLNQIGIYTLEDLVGVPPGWIEQRMVNVSLAAVKGWQTRARRILEEAHSEGRDAED